MQRSEKRNQLKALNAKAEEDNDSAYTKIRPLKQAKRRIKGTNKRLPPSSLPLSNPTNPANQAAKTFKAYIVHSPEQVALKAARKACEARAEAEGWYGIEEEEPEISVSRSESKKGDREFPVYFQKKHKSHKRRIKERRALIQANKDKLVEMYGIDIVRKDCRISIREIKIALGLVEKTEMDV